MPKPSRSTTQTRCGGLAAGWERQGVQPASSEEVAEEVHAG